MINPADRDAAHHDRERVVLAWDRLGAALGASGIGTWHLDLATMLLMYGVSVRTAGRAAQAIEILSGWRPDVLLCDIAMPGEDGYALIRRIRTLPPPIGTIPAVALTAYTEPQNVQDAFASGFDAHLGKPLEPHVLADALSKVLRFRRA